MAVALVVVLNWSCEYKQELIVPNIIIINVDDMGWKDTNAPIPNTPNPNYKE
jgi:hypothetical protein